jgi:1,4-alpha-glucan branching enzyme
MPNGGRTIRLHAPGARSVEVMGDFTNWQPFTLTTAPDGWWIAARPIDPGRYQLNVRVDGAAWSVPAGVPETVDEFGTPVGVLDLR